jgi:hypothetical protein
VEAVGSIPTTPTRKQALTDVRRDDLVSNRPAPFHRDPLRDDQLVPEVVPTHPKGSLPGTQLGGRLVTMEGPPKGDAFALANAQFGGCQIVAAFIDEQVRAPVQTAAPTSQSKMVGYVMLLKVIGWLRSIDKLREPADYQAAAACVRSLFEIGVDLTLLVHANTEHPMEKLLAWERSAKLRHAETMRRYLEGQKELPVGETTPMLDFANRFRQNIEAERERYWPAQPGKKSQHPARWTGRTLSDDAEEADSLSPKGFVRFYRLRYQQICWHVHGSGTLGLSGIDELAFPGIIALALAEIAEFATVAAEMVLRLVEEWSPETERRFVELSRRREVTTAILFNQHPAHRASMKG